MDGRELIIRSISKVDDFSKIRCTYLDNDLLKTTEQRREILKNRYFFHCQCSNCLNEAKDQLKVRYFQRKLGNLSPNQKICLFGLTFCNFGRLLIGWLSWVANQKPPKLKKKSLPKRQKIWFDEFFANTSHLVAENYKVI